MIFFNLKYREQNICVLIILSKVDSEGLYDFLEQMNAPELVIKSVEDIINYPDTGFTYSLDNNTLMFINRQTSMEEFINTYEHEKNHVEMYLCDKYDIDPMSEEASYLSGDLAELLYSKLTDVLLCRR